MKGRYKFTPLSGYHQDERLVRMDFNMAKAVGNVRYGREFVFYQDMLQYIYVAYKEIVWAYRRMEDVQSRLCRAVTGSEINSLMLVTRDGKRLGMLVGDKENAVQGLDIIKQHNSLVDVGFSREKEERYL